MNAKKAKTQERVNYLAEVINKANHLNLDSWNAFVRSIEVPMDMLPALMTGRAELTRIARPRALTEQECKAFFDLIATLIETNIALRQHAEQTAAMVGIWSNAFKQLESLGLRIDRFANFREHREDDEQE